MLLAAVLALSSADAATVGAAATQLRKALHIDNTDIGLLVTVSSLVAAAASIPFGVLADRAKRTRILGITVALWGLAMLWSAFSTSFTELLLARLALGVVTASAGPVVASMIGDYFPSGERGRVYSYILTGELLGAGVGFAVTGDVAALSWRAAFIILALPTFVLSRFLFQMPEPVRGSLAPLPGEGSAVPPPPPASAGGFSMGGSPAGGPPGGGPSVGGPPVGGPPVGGPPVGGPPVGGPPVPWADQSGPRRTSASYDPFPYPHDPYGNDTEPNRLGTYDDRTRQFSRGEATQPMPAPSAAQVGMDGNGPIHETDAQRVAREQGIEPDSDRILQADARRMGLWQATRYLLSIRSNTVLIIASACCYFYLSGLETFAAEFTSEQYGVPQALANLLMLVIGIGAVAGVLVGGTLSDYLLRRRVLNSRLFVAGGAALLCAVLFIPAILTRSTVTALPYLTLAAFALMAQNPPIDAARLDIVPPLLWGRAEGLRGMLRTAAQSLAPVLFGAFADLLGHGRIGLQWTFLIMLVPLLANGVILLIALRSYPKDVATAAAAPPPPPPTARRVRRRSVGAPRRGASSSRFSSRSSSAPPSSSSSAPPASRGPRRRGLSPDRPAGRDPGSY